MRDRVVAAFFLPYGVARGSDSAGPPRAELLSKGGRACEGAGRRDLFLFLTARPEPVSFCKVRQIGPTLHEVP